MLFNSKIFVFAFLPAAFAGYLLAARLAGPRAARLWIAGASLAFYAYWRWQFLPLLAGSILVNYVIAQRLAARPGRAVLIAGLAFNLLLLGFFKYRGLFAAVAGLPAVSLILPLGISFFTFQQVMFLVDTHRRDIQAKISLLDYACFVAFFPHLITGPIVRPRDIIPQFQALRPLQNWPARLQEGLQIFLLGLAKKLVLADSFARFADPGFAAAAAGHPLTLLEAWVALLAYALQIYFDFSGYSDMAIGLARLFGIDFPQNFNSPYQAANIADFWRRWNITLSRFLRDYLYIPLGGKRRGEARRILNLTITMLLGGLWHGAALKFVVWGGLHAAYLIIHGWFARAKIRLPGALGRALTLAAVILAWVPFRAANEAAAIMFYKSLAGANGLAVPSLFARVLPALPPWIHAVPVLPYLADGRPLSLPLACVLLLTGWAIALGCPNVQALTARQKSLATIGGFAFTLQALLLAPAIPFVYFQF